MRRLFIFLTAWLGGTVCLAGDNVNAAHMQAFQDWSVRCNIGATDECQMFQRASISGLSNSPFLLSISTGQDTSDHYAVATVPLGVYLSHGMEIRVDNNQIFKVLYEVCDTTSCHAGFKLSKQVLSSFQRGQRANFRVWVGREKAMDFPISLMGFTNAYAAFSNRELDP